MNIVERISKRISNEFLLVIYTVLLFFWMLVWCVGCATTTKPVLDDTTIPPGCENSIIYSTIPNPELTDVVITLITYEAAKHYPGARDAIDVSLCFLQGVLINEELTYADFACEVANEASENKTDIGIELMLFSQLIDGFTNVKIPIDACDRDIILKHIARQREYLKTLP